MSWLKRLYSSLRATKHDDDLDSELAFHLAMREREKLSQGATPEEARRLALERFGNVTRTKEDCRERSTLPWLDAAAQDLRYACRSMANNGRLTLAATACLAIGIGANTSVFSFVNAFLFQPLPSDVALVRRASGSPVSYPEYAEWQRHSQVFDEVFAYSPGERLAIGRDETDRALGETVSGNYFRGLGVAPALGRLLARGDESQPLAVVSHRFWKRRLFGDATVIGKSIWIDREEFTVVGVTPPTFQGMLTPWSTDVWITPYLHRDRLGDRRAEWILVAARLRPGVTVRVRQADAAMKSLDAGLDRQAAVRSGDRQLKRDPIVVVRDSGLSGSPVWSVFLAMSALLTIVGGIVFVIACANVAGLLMARALTRRREILIRLSLGATHGRVIRQLLTESCLLSLMGAGAGIVAAIAAGDSLAGLLPESISGGFRFQHGIDGNVLAFTLVMAAISVLVSGLAPAFRALRVDLAAAGKAQMAGGMPSSRLRQLLVVAQVAASVLVLCTAGVFIRSFQTARKADPGFDVPSLLRVDLSLRQQGRTDTRATEKWNRLRDRVGELPGVDSVSLADVFPLGNTRVAALSVLGETASATVDSNYFRAMGIAMLRGRAPHPDDRNVVVVNEALAQRLWPGQDPIGKFVRFDGTRPPQEVVGLTATGKYWSLSEPPRPFLYQHSNELAEPRVSLAIRTHAAPRGMAATVEEQIRRLNQDFSSGPVQTASEWMHHWIEPQRSAAVLLTLLGVTALTLAITGFYALLSQTVTQRTSDIAVRITLGASRFAVAWMLLRHSVRLIMVGTAVGNAGAYVISRLLASASGQVSPLDGVTMIEVAALLAVIGAAATLSPAYKAMRVDPVTALRTE